MAQGPLGKNADGQRPDGGNENGVEFERPARVRDLGRIQSLLLSLIGSRGRGEGDRPLSAAETLLTGLSPGLSGNPLQATQQRLLALRDLLRSRPKQFRRGMTQDNSDDDDLPEPELAF